MLLSWSDGGPQLLVAVIGGAYLQMKPAQRNKSLKEGEKEGQSGRRKHELCPPTQVPTIHPFQNAAHTDPGTPGSRQT